MIMTTYEWSYGPLLITADGEKHLVRIIYCTICDLGKTYKKSPSNFFTYDKFLGLPKTVSTMPIMRNGACNFLMREAAF